MSEGRTGVGLVEVVATLREMVSGLDAGVLDGAAAVEVLGLFGEVERLGAAGVALAAGRVEATRAWQGSGNRSAAHFVADRCGSSVRSAVVALETARRLESLPATEEALRSGTLSMAKVNEIASVAGDRPEKESELVAAAKSETLPALQEKCRAMRAEGTAGIEGYQRVRKSRFLRHWTDPDGAFRLEARLCPDAGAKVLAALEVHHRRIFAGARREGRRESYEAYAADALVALAEGDGRGPRGVVHSRVDHSALVRGYVKEGEVCDIPGVGPIPVAVVREMLDDGVLKVIVTKGVDVVAVAHGGRTIPAHVRSALETRDPKCVVPGCDVRDRLEIDHLVSFAEGGPTTLENLARLCHRHHALKTHQGWVLAGRPGAWTWDPPPEPPP
jgi:hypothetical protein